MPTYADATKVAEVEQRIRSYPPLVSIAEIRRLKHDLAEIHRRSGFVLQGGDCAESFADFSETKIESTYTLLGDMAAVLGDATRHPVVRIGRMAGQYAKPRSSDTETIKDKSLPSYRGDMVNSFTFDEEARHPDPTRMEDAYFKAAGTLNLLRSRDPEGDGRAPFYTSHEALLLPYEQALLRRAGDTGAWYDCSAHFLWIGDRTRQLDGGHVEFARGIANPIGVKVGPSTQPDELVRLTEVLNPLNEPGRLTLICRMGAAHIDRLLPPLLKAVKTARRSVLWVCDPMHGNTSSTSIGLKTRDFKSMLSEVQGFFYAHAHLGTCPSGLHLEMTGQAVTECIGGPSRLEEEDLEKAYRSCCDPRLNREQALEMAELVARELKLMRPATAAPLDWSAMHGSVVHLRPRRTMPVPPRYAIGAR
jgi:3-deoxy-7-phosphoheptulonate synthase